MKALLVAVVILLSSLPGAFAQAKKESKKDSVQLRSDIEALSKGKKIKTKKKQSVVRRRDLIPAKVDTTALKSGNQPPTPSSSNNPTPHDAVPAASNPEPPATPVAHPPAPAGTPSP